MIKELLSLLKQYAQFYPDRIFFFEIHADESGELKAEVYNKGCYVVTEFSFVSIQGAIDNLRAKIEEEK